MAKDVTVFTSPYILMSIVRVCVSSYSTYIARSIWTPVCLDLFQHASESLFSDKHGLLKLFSGVTSSVLWQCQAVDLQLQACSNVGVVAKLRSRLVYTQSQVYAIIEKNHSFLCSQITSHKLAGCTTANTFRKHVWILFCMTKATRQLHFSYSGGTFI